MFIQKWSSGYLQKIAERYLVATTAKTAQKYL